ncbi:MAG: elongation factor G [Clostridia bacterium]|nr:elongation factor G [Clostridia bacterium]
MKAYKSEDIRNVALLGHMGAGKTIFTEAALLKTGVINRLGKVEDGNTVSDFSKIEKEKGYSVNVSMIPVEYRDTKINFIDTPGFFDFSGEAASAVSAAGVAAIFIDGSAGVQVGTEKAWKLCQMSGMPRFFVINKSDKDDVNVDAIISSLKAKFGNTVASIDDKDALDEAVAGTDEELMEIYFDRGEFTDEEFKKGLYEGIDHGDLAPVYVCSALTGEGVDKILDDIVDIMTRPIDGGDYFAIKDEKGASIPVDEKGEPVVFVFKTIADPFLGKISLAKVISGTVKAGMELYNHHVEKAEKLGSVFFLRGNEQLECTEAKAGDIVALGKLQFTGTGDVLCTKASQVIMPKIPFDQPALFKAIETVKQGEDDKLANGLHRLMEEDPTFVLERNNETHQTLLGGQGEAQLAIIMGKLKEKYGVEVKEVPRKIAYRETIKGNSDVQGKHKKQSGGAGQYGDVHIKFSPSHEEFEFTESLFGGSVPKQYVPAVEKGLRECMEKGPLAGCKVVNVKAELYDGSYHDVDSNEMAFKIAASLAFKEGIKQAKPCLLEPIMKVEIIVPEDYMGDVMGDLNKRRGKIQGMEPQIDGSQKLIALVPQVELLEYAIQLRSMTQARASFTLEFNGYEEVPAQLAEKIIAEHAAQE